jgi:hypothetical protein
MSSTASSIRSICAQGPGKSFRPCARPSIPYGQKKPSRPYPVLHHIHTFAELQERLSKMLGRLQVPQAATTHASMCRTGVDPTRSVQPCARARYLGPCFHMWLIHGGSDLQCPGHGCDREANPHAGESVGSLVAGGNQKAWLTAAAWKIGTIGITHVVR